MRLKASPTKSFPVAGDGMGPSFFSDATSTGANEVPMAYSP